MFISDYAPPSSPQYFATSSLLVHGTVKDVKKCCKKLIEDCAEGGVFILSTECETLWDAKPENVRAIIDSAKEYGKYK